MLQQAVQEKLADLGSEVSEQLYFAENLLQDLQLEDGSLIVRLGQELNYVLGGREEAVRREEAVNTPRAGRRSGAASAAARRRMAARTGDCTSQQEGTR